MLSLFETGFLIGLIICMPMGAVGMLCLRYILVQGKASGMAAGLGIAVADAIAAFFASLGIAILLNFIKAHETWIQTLGAIILMGFGAFLLFTKKNKTDKKIERGLTHIFFIMLTITITNPLTLFSFAGVFAALGLETLQYDFLAAFVISAGVFLGSLAWWLILILITMLFTINAKAVHIINELAGGLLITMGVLSLYFAWFPL